MCTNPNYLDPFRNRFPLHFVPETSIGQWTIYFIMILLSIYIIYTIGFITSPSPYKYSNSINKTNQMTANVQPQAISIISKFNYFNNIVPISIELYSLDVMKLVKNWILYCSNQCKNVFDKLVDLIINYPQSWYYLNTIY
jgi:hypothetical protein